MFACLSLDDRPRTVESLVFQSYCHTGTRSPNNKTKTNDLTQTKPTLPEPQRRPSEANLPYPSAFVCENPNGPMSHPCTSVTHAQSARLPFSVISVAGLSSRSSRSQVSSRLQESLSIVEAAGFSLSVISLSVLFSWSSVAVLPFSIANLAGVSFSFVSVADLPLLVHSVAGLSRTPRFSRHHLSSLPVSSSQGTPTSVSLIGNGQ